MPPRPKIRSIHPALFTDEAHMALSPHAEILWLGILCDAADDGVFLWKPATLKARYRPNHDVDADVLLEELSAGDLVRRFEGTDGKPYGAIRNFKRFQSPKHPNKSGVALTPELLAYVGRKAEVDDSDEGGSASGEDTVTADPPRREATNGRKPRRGREDAAPGGDSAPEPGDMFLKTGTIAPAPGDMPPASRTMPPTSRIGVGVGKGVEPGIDPDSHPSVGRAPSPAHVRETAAPDGAATDRGRVLEFSVREEDPSEPAGRALAIVVDADDPLPPERVHRLRLALRGRAGPRLLTAAGLAPIRELLRRGVAFDVVVAELGDIAAHLKEPLRSFAGFAVPQIVARHRRRLEPVGGRPQREKVDVCALALAKYRARRAGETAHA